MGVAFLDIAFMFWKFVNLLVVISLFAGNCLCQLPRHGVRNVSKVSFLSPGFSYEQKTAQSQAVYGRAYFDPSGYLGYSGALGTSSGFYLNPAITIQYRYYYNLAHRAERGKRTEMNSSNYLGPVFKTTFDAEGTGYSVHRLGAVWGFQRNFESRFSIDLNVGVGYAFVARTGDRVDASIFKRSVNEVTLLGQLNLGFWLNKRT